MDTDCAGFEDYAHCLTDLAKVNVVTLTHRPILAWLAKETAGLQEFSLCDIGCGHGDLLRRIWTWSRRRGLTVHLEGVDRHPWSIRAAREATSTADITYREADLFSLPENLRYDFIVSSQFTHHLTDQDLVRFIRWQEAHASRGWFIADLHRHPIAYYSFPLIARSFRWHHLVREDGQVSIARAFIPREWRDLLAVAGVPPGAARIRWHVPFRLCVSRQYPS